MNEIWLQSEPSVLQLQTFSPLFTLTPQPHPSWWWTGRISVWRQRRIVVCMRSVALCALSTSWPAPSLCPGPTDATSTSATGLSGVSWSGCLKSTVWGSCSAPAPTPCVVRGGGRPSCPPAPTRTRRVCSQTASISRASAAEMICAGKARISLHCNSGNKMWTSLVEWFSNSLKMAMMSQLPSRYPRASLFWHRKQTFTQKYSSQIGHKVILLNPSQTSLFKYNAKITKTYVWERKRNLKWKIKKKMYTVYKSVSVV